MLASTMDLDSLTMAAIGSELASVPEGTIKSVRASAMAVWACVFSCLMFYCTVLLLTSYLSLLGIVLAAFTGYILHRQLLVVYTLMRHETDAMADTSAEFSRAEDFVVTTVQAKIIHLCNLGTHVIETPRGGQSLFRYYTDKVYSWASMLRNLVSPQPTRRLS